MKFCCLISPRIKAAILPPLKTIGIVLVIVSAWTISHGFSNYLFLLSNLWHLSLILCTQRPEEGYLRKKGKPCCFPRFQWSKEENVNSSGKMFLKGSFRYFMPLPSYNIIRSRPAQWMPLTPFGSSVTSLRRVGLPLLLPHRSSSAACRPHAHSWSSWSRASFQML